jgi:hypothetical protein
MPQINDSEALEFCSGLGGEGWSQQLSRHSSVTNALEFWVRRKESRVRVDGFGASAKLVIDDAVVVETYSDVSLSYRM